MRAVELSRELRTGSSPSLTRRRTVGASAQAYARFSMPHALLGLGSYAATMAPAAAGSARESAA
jgi:hypothetical protein